DSTAGACRNRARVVRAHAAPHRTERARRRARRADRRRTDTGPRPAGHGLAQPSGPLHQHLPARRRHRHAVAPVLRQDGRDHRAAVRGGEPQRFRRHGRGGRDRQVPARRLHGRPLQHRPARHRADALRQPALRRGAGLHLRLRPLAAAQPAGGQQRPAGALGAGAGGAAQGQRRQVRLRLLRHRHHAAPLGRDAEADGRGGHPARALPRRRPGAARPAGRSGAPHHGQHPGPAARRARGQDTGAGGHRPAAQPGGARPAGHGGGPARLRDDLLGRRLRPRRDAGAGGGAALGLRQAGAGEPRPGARLPGARRHALVDHARGARRLPRPRGSPARAADPGERRARGV
ncbi:MAG: BUG/TctC family periplasmic protein, partial [uncultured Solirubrobacteraceae bacterium]